jgi:hypothetical protein
VLVLEADKMGWKEGVQAVVAELLTAGYALSVRASRAESVELLQQELKLQVTDFGLYAAVAVTRDGDGATAVVCRQGAESCDMVQLPIDDDELSRSRLALAVVERLRPLDLPSMPPRPVPAASRPGPPRRPVVERPRERAPWLRPWLGGGVTLSSGTSAPMSWLSASLGLTVSDPWGIEVGLGGSPLPGRAETYAGSLSLRALQAMAFGTFEPFSRRAFSFGLGLGGGALRLQETAAPASGFDGVSLAATVGVVSARARIVQRLGPVYWGIAVDPGLLVPSVKVEAGTDTVLRIGRPWVSVQTSIGVAL